jgi:hypothetical protein
MRRFRLARRAVSHSAMPAETHGQTRPQPDLSVESVGETRRPLLYPQNPAQERLELPQKLKPRY